MTGQPVSSSRALFGRQSECDALDSLLAQLRVGGSAAMMLRGEAGVGKTALLDYLVAAAGDLRVVRVSGVESEMELPWLDRASAQVLAFAARRLLAESVLMILATREPDRDLHGLPEPSNVPQVPGTVHADVHGDPGDAWWLSGDGCRSCQ